MRHKVISTPENTQQGSRRPQSRLVRPSFPSSETPKQANNSPNPWIQKTRREGQHKFLCTPYVGFQTMATEPFSRKVQPVKKCAQKNTTSSLHT